MQLNSRAWEDGCGQQGRSDAIPTTICPMPSTSPSPKPPGPPEIRAWQDDAEKQEGVVSRGQLMQLNLSSAAARTNLDNGRWRGLLPGVYATFTGPVGPLAMVWSAVLYAGTGAAACGPTALWLTGAIDDRPALVHVAVPASRRVVRQPGIRIHLSRALDDKVRDIAHPSARPRRL